MENQNKCSNCALIFSEEKSSFEMPCKHILCETCYEKSFNFGKKLIKCPLDQKLFNMYLQNNEEFSQKLICNKHEDEEIKFVHFEKKEFMCPICLYDNHFTQNDAKKYLKSDFFDDLNQMEEKLLELAKKLKEDIKSIQDFRLKKFLNSKEIQIFLSNSLKFFNHPIDPKFTLKCFDGDVIENQEVIHNNVPKPFKVRLQEMNDEILSNNRQINLKLEEINGKIEQKLEDKINLMDQKIQNTVQLFNEQILQNSQLLNDQVIQKITSYEAIFKGIEFKFKIIDVVNQSDILKSHKNNLFLFDLFKIEDKQIKKLTRIFRASDHQFKSAKFHELCDNKGPTLVVIQAKDSKRVFGGYASESWNASIGTIHSAPGSFLFQFDFKTKHTIYQNENNAMYSNSSYNPRFGSGGADFHIHSDCNANTSSYSNLGFTYSLPNKNNNNNELMTFGSEEAQSYLAGSYQFCVSEFEVFTISFE